MRAFPNEHDCDAGVTNILPPDFTHYVLWVVAVNEVIVVERTERFRSENSFQLGPVVNEGIHFSTIIVKRRDKHVPLWWRLRCEEWIPSNSIEATHGNDSPCQKAASDEACLILALSVAFLKHKFRT